MHLVEIKIPAVREISFLLKEQTISNSMNNTLLWHFNCIATYFYNNKRYIHQLLNSHRVGIQLLPTRVSNFVQNSIFNKIQPINCSGLVFLL